jgi:uncharacterized YceG family protein
MAPPGDVPRGPATAGSGGTRRLVALVLLVVVLAALLWLLNAVLQPFAGEGQGRVAVRIPEGASVGEIGDLLAAQGIVDSGLLFALRARVSGAGGELRSGPHTLRRDMSYGAAITALSTPPPPAPAVRTIDVTLPEGPSRRELAPLVEEAGVEGDYLRATARIPDGFSLRRYGAPSDTRTLEGFLFPSTYELREGATARTLVDRQLDAFRENFGEVDLSYARRRGLDAYDVLIIASMIEREAQVERERRLISAVIYNRLRQGIPLGIDATIRYANSNWTRPLRQSELQEDNAYNTRTNQGLPPTPIGNPGLGSIRAAADPANVDYLYYVAEVCGNGAHEFTASAAEFERFVAEYNAARERRGGQSPTNC